VLQITGEMFKQEAGIDIKHVPYRGSVQAVTDTLAGHVGMVVTGTASVAPHIQTGKLVAIAVASPARSRTISSAPTFIESGYPGVIMANWFGLLGPKGLPQPIVERINKALADIIGDPALKDLADQSDLNLRLTTGEQWQKELADEYRRIGAAIEKAGMKTK
jgi:tripartite-type tricarboxylate transporter receptor subunit TctC